MITRRALLPIVVSAPLALSGCSFCYEAEALWGRYRANASLIAETLTLFRDGTYLHEWRDGGVEPRWNRSTWTAECSLSFDEYVPPLLGKPRENPTMFFGGPPEFWFFGRNRFFSAELDVEYVWAGTVSDR